MDGLAVSFGAKAVWQEIKPPLRALLDWAGIDYFIEENLAEDIAAGRLPRLLPDWPLELPGEAHGLPWHGAGVFPALGRQSSVSDAARRQSPKQSSAQSTTFSRQDCPASAAGETSRFCL